MQLLGAVIGAGWIVFWLYWLISAFGAKKNTGSNMNRFAAVRLGLFVLVIIFIHISLGRAGSFNNHPWANNNAIIAGVGFIVYVGGLGLAVWARVHLGKNWGMPMTKKQDPELVTTGPYRFIRHPIYTGILAAVLGSALATTLYLLIALAVLAVYFIYSALVEEKIMLREFPKQYPGYKKKTKMLLPFVL